MLNFNANRISLLALSSTTKKLTLYPKAHTVGNKYKKSYEHECMFWLWAWVLFWKFPKLREPKASAIWNFKTSRATINHEMHVQVYTKYRCFNDYRAARASTSIFLLTFYSVAHFCHTINQVGVAFKVFWMLFCCSTSFWFDKAKATGRPFCFQLWSLRVLVSIATSVLQSIT